MKKDKETVKWIEETKIVEVPYKVEVPVITNETKTIERIVEKIVKIPKTKRDDGGDEGDKCMSQVNFVRVWNNLMNIKFSYNVLTDECLSDKKFLDLIVENIAKNQERIKAGK